MPSFINYNNKQELSSNEYTKLQISEALYLTETKSSRKIESLTEGLNRTTSLKDALDLFENKLVAMNALSATKQTYSGTLYEGQFSWMTQDTGAQIGSEKENTIDVWMYDNKGNQYYEKGYDGYGEFGGMDYYELLARMNGYTDEDLQDKKILKSIRVMGKGSMRDIGIALAFENKLKTRDKGGDVLFPALVADGRYNWKRHNFKQEAESDPNQSWFQEEEYDDYEDDEDYEQGWYESFMTEAQKVNEWGSSDQSIFLDAMHKDAGKPKKMPSPFDSKLRQAAEDAVDFYWEDWDEYKSDRDGLVDDAVRSYLRKYFKKDFDMMVKMFEPMKESLSEAASNFRVLLRTSKDESIGRKIRLGDKRDPGHEIWEKIDKNHWMNLQTEEKLDLSEWAKRADEFNMADQDLQFENLSESDKVNEAFSRMSKDVIENELFAASQALTTYYDWLKAGNDSGKGESIDHVISLLKKCKKNIKRFNNKEEVEGTLYEAKFVKEFDEAVLDATTKEEVLELYPNAEFFIGSSNHFFGELDENLFFKAYYTKGQKEFKIKSVYSEKNKNYVHLYNESLVAEGSSKEFEKALAHYAEIGGHSSNGRRELVDAYWSLLNKKQRDEYFMPLAHAQYAKNNKVGWAKEVTEKTYNKKSLMKAMKADDGMIQLGNGQEYVIYAYGNGNDHNDDMWRDKTIFALDQDGEEHEIEYSDIVRYDESYDESKLTWHGLKESLGIATINEKKNDLNLDTIEQYVREVIDGGKSFMDIGKRLKGLYKYDFSTGMMPMYIIPVSGNKIVIINKKYVEKGQADRIVGDIAIGLMESMNERRFGQNSDDALILIQQALRGMKNMKAEIKGDTVIISNKAKDEFTYSLNDGGDVQEFIDELEESIVNEGRSINKISKEFGETVANMKKTVDEWKTSEGDRKAELLEKLRELNKMKANLEKELDEAVSGKDKNITLALGEE